MNFDLFPAGLDAVQMKKVWLEHMASCTQCQKYNKGELRTTDDGTGWARSWDACSDGREIHSHWEKMMDKEQKNRQ